MGNNIKQMLASFGSLFSEIVLEGFKEYHSAYARTSAAHSKTSRASLIHDHMIEKAKMLLPAPFRFTKHFQRDVFTFSDEMVVQLKRLGHDLMPRNFPTPTNSLLYHSGSVEGLHGIPSQLPFITIGYIPDEYWLSPMGVFATQIMEHRPFWIHRLDGVSETQPELPIPIHTTHEHRQNKARLKTLDLPGRARDVISGGTEKTRAG